MSQRNELREILQATLTSVTSARSYLQHRLIDHANVEDEDEEMHTRMDDDVAGALIDIEGAIARIARDYPAV